MPSLNHKWTGPACCLAGIVLLVTQVYAYLIEGLISAKLLGGGIGLLLVGAAAWFHYVDDKRSGAPITREKEIPTADEYDRRFEEMDGDETDLQHD